ncbi:MAG TPA: 30S ribosomal protein S8 [Candidatus Hydrogenedentes bacterium]|nr:30S ribosomal protein S8 [Candidatus Hydrogenedentota bacterium]HPG69459.1 30S ribosomal protein S8 [Candidatus Hydrogenedentota bacterium]
MSMSDPIADLLTRIRNALNAGHEVVEIPTSRLKEQVCAVLKSEGYVRDCETIDAGGFPRLRVELKYLADSSPVIHGLRRISRPSLRVFVRYDQIHQVRSGVGISILTTSRGVMTGKQARAAKVGGEVLCEVW